MQIKIMDVINPIYNAIVKNNNEWLPCISAAGIVTTIAGMALSLNSVYLFSGSLYITGGLVFAASQIGFQLFQTESKKEALTWITVAAGLAATVAFAYLTAVPILTALFFAILGHGTKLAMEYAHREYKSNFLQWTISNLSYGTAAGFIFETFVRQRGYIKAVLAGGICWMAVITIHTGAVSYFPEYLTNRFEDLTSDRKSKFNYAVHMGAALVVCYVSPISAIESIFMIVIANGIR